jgi:hypothetical protein
MNADGYISETLNNQTFLTHRDALLFNSHQWWAVSTTGTSIFQ